MLFLVSPSASHQRTTIAQQAVFSRILWVKGLAIDYHSWQDPRNRWHWCVNHRSSSREVSSADSVWGNPCSYVHLILGHSDAVHRQSSIPTPFPAGELDSFSDKLAIGPGSVPHDARLASNPFQPRVLQCDGSVILATAERVSAPGQQECHRGRAIGLVTVGFVLEEAPAARIVPERSRLSSGKFKFSWFTDELQL